MWKLLLVVAWVPVHTVVATKVYKWAMDKWKFNYTDPDDYVIIRFGAAFWPVVVPVGVLGTVTYKTLVERPMKWVMGEKKDEPNEQAEVPDGTTWTSARCGCNACQSPVTYIGPQQDPKLNSYADALGLSGTGSSVTYEEAQDAAQVIYTSGTHENGWSVLVEYFGLTAS